MNRPFRLQAPKPARLNENDVESVLLDALRWRHWRPERLHAGTFKTLDGRFIKAHPKGTPDYVVIHERFPAFYLEVKRPGKLPTPEQEIEHTKLRLDHLAVVTVDNYDALMAWLDKHERKTEQLWHGRDK